MRYSRNARYLRCGGLFLLACILMPFFLFGCAGGKSVENNTEYRDHTSNTMQKDSLKDSRSRDYMHFEKDSSYKLDSVVVMMKGDTIIKDRWHFLKTEKTKTIHRTDTVVREINHYFSKIDTLKFYINRKIKVEKKLTWWERQKLECCGFFMGAFIVVTLLFLNERRLRLGKKNNTQL